MADIDTDALTGLEIRYHNAMPKWAKLIGLRIKAVPECEGGGFAVDKEQAEAIIALLERVRELEAERVKPAINVDLALAVQQLQANPELAEMMTQLCAGEVGEQLAAAEARAARLEGLLREARRPVQYANEVTGLPAAATTSPLVHKTTGNLLTRIDAALGETSNG